jgi:hypothetical protein
MALYVQSYLSHKDHLIGLHFHRKGEGIMPKHLITTPQLWWGCFQRSIPAKEVHTTGGDNIRNPPFAYGFQPIYAQVGAT